MGNERLNDFRNELIGILGRSQSAFEKQLSYISAGGIGVSMAFIEKIVDLNNACCKCLLILGWLLLSATLLINLISHLVAFYNHSKTIEEINNEKYMPEKAVSRNKRIELINILTIATLIFGILFIIIFVSINI